MTENMTALHTALVRQNGGHPSKLYSCRIGSGPAQPVEAWTANSAAKKFAKEVYHDGKSLGYGNGANATYPRCVVSVEAGDGAITEVVVKARRVVIFETRTGDKNGT